jgi:hypothetical protein
MDYIGDYYGGVSRVAYYWEYFLRVDLVCYTCIVDYYQ